MGYTLSRSNHGSKVLTKDKKRRIIKISSNVNISLPNEYDLSNIQYFEIIITSGYSTVNQIQSTKVIA